MRSSARGERAELAAGRHSRHNRASRNSVAANSSATARSSVEGFAAWETYSISCFYCQDYLAANSTPGNSA